MMAEAGMDVHGDMSAAFEMVLQHRYRFMADNRYRDALLHPDRWGKAEDG